MFPEYFLSPFYDKYNVYKPVYNDKVDYQTNAKSYYDFLARVNKELIEIEKFINRLLVRDLDTITTDTIDIKKIGNWLSDKCCQYDDVIKLKADVKISSHITLKILEATKKTYELDNAISVYEDGLYVPNLLNLISALDKEIVEIKKDLVNINQEITKIHQDIKNINKEINNIKNDITNIYNQLSALTGGGNFKRMIKDKDYKLTFFNGFYTETNDIYVGFIKTQDGVLLNVKQINVVNSLNNKNLLNIKLSHGNSVNDVPESRLLGIEFIGEYEKWNNFLTKSYNQSANLIWNVRPTSLRASWVASYGLSRNNYNMPFLYHISSYADGYNSQFTVYKTEDIRLEGGNFGSTITLLDPDYDENNTEDDESENESESEGGKKSWQADLQEMLFQKNQ